MMTKVIIVTLLGLVPIIKADDPLCQGLDRDKEFLFPAAGMCNQYYKCYNGVFSIERCDQGLYYTDTLKQCVRPEYAECMGGNPVLPTDPPTTTISTTLETEPPSPLCQGLESGKEFFFPSVGSCNQYYRCYNGVFSIERCDQGFYYTDTLKQCVRPEYAECMGGNPVLPTDPETTISTTVEWVDTVTPSTTTTPITTPPTTTTLSTSTSAPNDGKDPRCIGNNTTYWSHPVECHLYIECYRGDSYEMRCPPDSFFSENVKLCVSASASECCIGYPSRC